MGFSFFLASHSPHHHWRPLAAAEWSFSRIHTTGASSGTSRPMALASPKTHLPKSYRDAIQKNLGFVATKPRAKTQTDALRHLVLYLLFWFLAAHARHQAFHSGAADLGIFTNAIWNIAHNGWPYSSLKGGTSLLADHQNFLIYPLALLFRWLPNPNFLLALQAMGLASGGIALYCIGLQYSTIKYAAILPLCYWAFAPLRAANLFDFHPEVFLLPLFLFGISGVQSKSKALLGGGWLCLLFGSLAKESGGPVAAGLGLAWILGAAPASVQKRSRWIGLLLLLWGIALFWLDTKTIPILLGTHYSYNNVYAPLGTTPIELVFSIFQNPGIFFSRLFSLTRIKFLVGMFLPFLALPFLAPRALIAALPGFLMLFLTAGDYRISLGFHYAIEPAVGVFFALAAALATPHFLRGTQLLLPVLPFSLLLFFGRSELFQWRFHNANVHQIWVRDNVIPNLDPQVSVSASSALVPHLSSRHWVHFLPILEKEDNTIADCVLWEQSVNNTPMNKADEDKVKKILSEQFSEELHCKSLTIFQKRNLGKNCLLLPARCPRDE